ncbi:MAG: hypothetical protein IJY28_03845 [Clostridia bacterium]|nr:hypothetical protein [Clostridia bacterium]
MTLRIEADKLKRGLLYILLFLAAMNFAAKFFYFVFLAFLLLCLIQRRIKMDRGAWIYLLLGVLTALYNMNEGILSMIRCFAPFCFYLVGINLAAAADGGRLETQDIGRSVQTCDRVLMVTAFGSFTHFIANYIYNFGQNLWRNTNDIWTGAPMAATGQGALACLMVGLLTAMLFFPLKPWHRAAGAANAVLLVLYSMVLAVRTPLVMLLIMVFIALAYHFIRARSASLRTAYVLGAALAVVIALLAYLLNIGGLQDYVLSTPMFERFTGSLGAFTDNSSRTEAKLAFLRDALDYPLGGLHLQAKYGFAHDLLLDGYDEYGIFGLILLSAVLITGICKLCQVLRCDGIRMESKMTLLLVYLAILLEFTMEPILAGMQWLFACYCLINGVMHGLHWTHDRAKEDTGIR